MTYKDIINRFRTITEDHLMLEDFGYGDLSDLKYVSQIGTEQERVQYPYLYLLPSSSTRNGPVMNYAFNMIIMDMARPEDGPNTDKFDNYITIQSQCQQYIDDVLAQLYYFYKDQPEIQLTGITYTPFKEKYQDVLAGMTATINIAVPTPLNECIAPFGPIAGTTILEVTTPSTITAIQGSGELPLTEIVLDTYNQWENTGGLQSYYKQERFPTLISTLELTVTLTATQNWPAIPWSEINLYWNNQNYTGAPLWPKVEVTGWPSTAPLAGETFTVTYNNTLPNTGSYGTVGFGRNGQFIAGLSTFFSASNGTMKIITA